MADKRFRIINPVTSAPSTEVNAPVADNIPQPAVTGATIPEAGMCGFDGFDFASYDRLNKEYWGRV